MSNNTIGVRGFILFHILYIAVWGFSYYRFVYKTIESCPGGTSLVILATLLFLAVMEGLMFELESHRNVSSLFINLSLGFGSYILAGSTATFGSAADCEELSYKRAQTIRELMIDMGAPLDRITCVGLGYNHPFHEQDINPDGTLNEAIAPRNRAVIILEANSPEAKELGF